MSKYLKIASSIQLFVMLTNICFILIVYNTPYIQVPQYFYHCLVAVSGIIQTLGMCFLLAQIKLYEVESNKDLPAMSSLCNALRNIERSVSIVFIMVDFCFCVSYFSLFLAGFQRFYLSTFPFRYNRDAWKKNLKKLVSTPWLIAVLLLSFEVLILLKRKNMSHKMFNQVYLIIAIILIILLIITCLVNIKVFKKSFPGLLQISFFCK